MATPKTQAGPGALRPEVLARLGGLSVKARQVVEGVLSGLHRSPHHGQSIEFAEHKEYAPGDEIRHIDWKAYAKFDKYYVKQFEHETNLRAYLMVDASHSMAYGSGEVSKLEYAKVLAASLAYLLVRQGDSVGLVVFGEEVRSYVPVRSGTAHLQEVIGALEASEAEGATDFEAAAHFLSERARRRAMVLLFSDFLDPDDAKVAAVRRLRARKHDIGVFHLMDRAELDFPFEDPSLFVSMEDDRRLQVNPIQIRDSYREEVQAFIEATRRRLRESDVQYRLVVTDTPYDQVVAEFLSERAQGRRR
ncbi:MAG: DUF58 domain-containing protein [Deltaproteobacteria bacterium]|nr:MAG: DUF58 domain-containing protein [Deltaproteobacteria bacterium]